MNAKKQNYEVMRELGYTIKRRRNPLYGKIKDAAKYNRYWMSGNTIVCFVGEEGQMINEKMPRIRPNAEQVLRENYLQAEGVDTFVEWVILEKDSDPGFFRWLFDDDQMGDFESSMTVRHCELYDEFLQSIK